MDVVINYDVDDKKFYIAPPYAFKMEERHFVKLGEKGVDTLLKTGVADLNNYSYKNKIFNTKAYLNVKELCPYFFEDKPKFYSDDDLKESKKI